MKQWVLLQNFKMIQIQQSKRENSLFLDFIILFYCIDWNVVDDNFVCFWLW